MDEPTTPAWAALIRDVPDFPSPGIVFKDIVPLLADAGGLAAMLSALAAPWRDAGIEAVAGTESRGFILGAALARELDAGFVPLRKPGKLPGALLEEAYSLEYGSDRLQIQAPTRFRLAPGCCWSMTCWPRAARWPPPRACCSGRAPGWRAPRYSSSWPRCAAVNAGRIRRRCGRCCGTEVRDAFARPGGASGLPPIRTCGRASRAGRRRSSA